MSIDRRGTQAHTLQLAIALHQNGETDKAEAIYRDIVRREPRNLQATYLLGLLCAQQGKLEDAEKLFGKAVRFKPDFIDAHYNKGVTLNALGRHDAALKCYDHVLRLKRDHEGALHNRAGSLFELRYFADALEGYDRVLALKQDHAQALDNRGVALRELKRFEEALASHERALEVVPDNVEALNNRGIVLRILRRPDEALRNYDRAIQIKPDFAEAHHNRAIALLECKRFDEALQSCDRALQIAPGLADVRQTRGVALLEMARFAEALQCFGSVLDRDPQCAEAWSNGGLACRGLNRLGEALQRFDRAIAIKSDFAKAYNNRGLTLTDLGRFEEALVDFDRSIELEPDYADAWYNRGIPLNELKRFDEAVQSYERVVAINEGYEFVLGARLYAKLRTCDWTELEKDIAAVCDRAARGDKASHPFTLLAATQSLSIQRTAAETWTHQKAPQSRRLPGIDARPWREKIRIGYFSADFHRHAVAYLLAGLLEQHDRSKFELIAFSLDSEMPDDMRERLRSCFHEFLDVTALSDEEIALLARKNEIDIAIDLQGFTRGSRTNIFAMRAAPLQVNFLGYPGTMGAEYIDYLIADSVVIPPSHQSHYTEKIVYLPNTFLPTDRTRAVAESTPTRAEAGLPERGFVFCCFNNSHKILPDVFDIWMRLLKQIDGSVLWLFNDNASAAANLRTEASARKVDPDRLIFANYVVEPADHLARLRCADLFLDTLPYNAHATASDALWVGLPIVTRIGETFAGRVAASLLHALDVPELVATTAEAYEALAVSLARNPDALKEVKRKLAANRLAGPLFDTVRFTDHVEAAYTAIYERRQAALPPDHIHIPAG